MKNSQKILLELQKLNLRLSNLGLSGRFMLYSASPWKFALFNFISGIFHSLGSLIGTFIIAGILVYFFSQIDFIRPITQGLEQILSQINWNKLMPTPPPLPPLSE